MSYRFKLETLRRYRRFQEESLQKALSEAQRLKEQEALELARLEDRRRDTEAALKKHQAQSTTSSQLAIYDGFLKRIAADIALQQRKLDQAELVCEQKREALMLGMQKRKTLEKLKENGFKEYLKTLNREELKFINEMAISRFNLSPK